MTHSDVATGNTGASARWMYRTQVVLDQDESEPDLPVFRYLIEARATTDPDSEWNEWKSHGGFYDPDSAQRAGEARIPDGYPWFTGPEQHPMPGDRYEYGNTVIASCICRELGDGDPPATVTEYAVMLLRPDTPYYVVALVRGDGKEIGRTEHVNIVPAAASYADLAGLDPLDFEEAHP
jgi:hypothetical protein